MMCRFLPGFLQGRYHPRNCKMPRSKIRTGTSHQALQPSAITSRCEISPGRHLWASKISKKRKIGEAKSNNGCWMCPGTKTKQTPSSIWNPRLSLLLSHSSIAFWRTRWSSFLSSHSSPKVALIPKGDCWWCRIWKRWSWLSITNKIAIITRSPRNPRLHRSTHHSLSTLRRKPSCKYLPP